MTQLRYDVTTSPFPLQASPASGTAVMATLTVVASNPNADPEKNPVTLQGLTVTIPVGPGAAALMADATGVGPVAPEGWKANPPKPGTGKVDYVFEPKPGKGVVGKQGLVFTFNNIKVNTQPGPCQLTLKEGTAGSPTTQLGVTKFPNGWGNVAFWLVPPDVPFKGSTQLNWVGPAGATYTIQYALGSRVVNVPAQGEPPLGSRGEYPAQGEPPLKLDRTTTFTLKVEESISGIKYQAQEQKTASVQVPPPRVISFTASPSRLNPSGDTDVTLSWETENVSALYIGDTDVSDRDKSKGKWAATCTEPKSFLVRAYGVEGYSGPPVSAHAGVGRVIASGPLSVWREPSRELWTFGLGPNRPLFKLKLRIDSSSSSRRGETTVRTSADVSIELAANVSVADFGHARGGVGSNELYKAAYGTSMPRAGVWTGNAVITFPEWGVESGSYNGYARDAGSTWGLKSADGKLALVWFDGAKSLNPNNGGDWSFEFVYIDFSRLAKLHAKDESEGGDGETV